MATIASGYSFYTIVSDGTTDTYPLNFALGELKRTYVRVYVDGEVDGGGAQIYRQIEDVPGETGMVRVLGGIVPAGGRVNFQRIVPKDMLIHRYNNGSILDYPSLDESHDQLMMAMHEVLDGIGLKNVFTDINMNGFKITNIYTDLDDPNSVATVGSLGPYRADAIAAAQSAAQSATDAHSEYQNAQTERVLTEAQSSLAQQAAVDSQSSAAAADDSEAQALAHANTALQAALDANAKLQELINAGMPVPIGMMAPFPVDRQPSGWAVVMGQTLQRTVYPQAVAFLTGDDTTPSFTLPDLRGEFVRGADLGRGVDAGRVVGSEQGDAAKQYAAVMSISAAGGVRTREIDTPAWTSTHALGSGAVSREESITKGVELIALNDDENRPRNVAVVWCIKLVNHPVDVTQADINAVLAALNTMAQAVNPSNGKYRTREIRLASAQAVATGVDANVLTTGADSGTLNVTPNSGDLGWTANENGVYRINVTTYLNKTTTASTTGYLYLRLLRGGTTSLLANVFCTIDAQGNYDQLTLDRVVELQAGDVVYFTLLASAPLTIYNTVGEATITRLR